MIGSKVRVGEIGEDGRRNRRVMLTADIELSDDRLTLTWDALITCLQFAKSFASTYPGWELSFEIYEATIGRAENYLGRFVLGSYYRGP